MNQVQLVGNLCSDPEHGTTQNGINYCRFRVACQRRFKNQQGQYDADFISCLAWRGTADFVHQHFFKGNKIGLTGSIQTGSYQAQDGSTRYTFEVLVDNVEFVTQRQDNGGGYGQPTPPPAPPGQQRNEQQRMDLSGQSNDFTEVDDDELPF